MSRAKNLPDWRSLLFCPASNARFVAKAHTRGADAVILDLEDSVAANGKAAARAGLQAAVAAIRHGGGPQAPDVGVRINRPLALAVEDIAAAVAAGAAFLVLPKVMGPEHVALLAEVAAAHEADLGRPVAETGFLAVVEDARALARIDAIAAAERLVGLAVGGEDFATDLGAEPSFDALYVAKMLGVHAARAAGILPVGVLAGLSNLGRPDDYAAMLKRSRGVGFAAAMCVHPNHVTLINAEYGPAPEEVERAARLVAAFDAAEAAGLGVIAFEDRMIDRPVAARARRLLARSGAAASAPAPAQGAAR